jgi:protoporphyrinogen oxidase
MNDPGRVLIVGGGPTGLGAAWRLQELGFDDFLLLEACDGPGGLASSYLDPSGFTWDIGGHVQFSHYRYYDQLLDRALGDAWLHHERESWVFIRQRFVPYPFQNNIHRLDPDERTRVLQGLERATADRDSGRPATNFGDWILATFGDELAQLFMYPYNFKVWGYPASALGVRWMGERVAVPDLERIRRNVREMKDDVSWGPNSTFRFPVRGGTGAIWRGVASLLDPRHVVFGARVTGVALADGVLRLADGRSIPYDTLISSMPLTDLCDICEGLSSEATQAARSLMYSSVHVFGVGLRGGKPESLRKKCWIYFPEPESPYYRVTVFSNYSPHNVPSGDGYWSLMAEVCESPAKPVVADALEGWTLSALARDGLIPAQAEVVSVWHRREEHGYPTPSLERDRILGVVQPVLEEHGVHSRGRFGAWKYEVSSQDHSCMQGVELAERLLGCGEEVTINRPDYVNSGALLNGRPGESRP